MNDVDITEGNTPLHWAVYEFSELALSYLLAWGPEIDKKDLLGQTPLHIAVR